LNIELGAYPDGPFGARRDAKPTPFAQISVDPDKALLQRSISCLTGAGQRAPKKIRIGAFFLYVKAICGTTHRPQHAVPLEPPCGTHWPPAKKGSCGKIHLLSGHIVKELTIWSQQPDGLVHRPQKRPLVPHLLIKPRRSIESCRRSGLSG
jgi:hypothetical protein